MSQIYKMSTIELIDAYRQVRKTQTRTQSGKNNKNHKLHKIGRLLACRPDCPVEYQGIQTIPAKQTIAPDCYDDYPLGDPISHLKALSRNMTNSRISGKLSWPVARLRERSVALDGAWLPPQLDGALTSSVDGAWLPLTSTSACQSDLGIFCYASCVIQLSQFRDRNP